MLDQLYRRVSLKEPVVERCTRAKTKSLEIVTEDQANALGITGQVELDITILPNARRAMTTGSAANVMGLTEYAPERICRVAQSDGTKLTRAEKLSH